MQERNRGPFVVSFIESRLIKNDPLIYIGKIYPFSNIIITPSHFSFHKNDGPDKLDTPNHVNCRKLTHSGSFHSAYASRNHKLF